MDGILTRIAAALILAGAVFGQAMTARTTTLAVPEGFAIRGHVSGDVNGDGLDDLIIAVSGSAERPGRSLRAHLRRKASPPFAATPDHEVTLTKDVVGFLVAPLGPGKEHALLVFNRRSLFRLPWKSGGRARPEKLLDVGFLWQNPGPSRIASWNEGVQDLDGDGLVDLIVPQAEGWLVAYQARGEDGRARFERVTRLDLPKTAADDRTTPRGAYRMEGRRARKKLQTQVSLGSSIEVQQSAAPLLEITEALAMAIPCDWDGDGDLDLMGRTAEMVHVWTQEPKGSFASAPTISLKAPVVADQERRLDVSYSAHVADLNRDRRADCVLVAGDRRSSEVKTQVLLYLQGGRGASKAMPLFGERGIPDQLVPLAGFAARPQLVDVNRDGFTDLALAVFRPDLLDQIGSSGSKTLDLGWYVFLNRRGKLSPRADLQTMIRVASSDLRSARRFLTLGFIDDVSGDGFPDLLVQSSPKSVRILAPRPLGRGRLEMPDESSWKMSWESGGEVSVTSPGPTGRPELVIETGRTLLHVEFGR